MATVGTDDPPKQALPPAEFYPKTQVLVNLANIRSEIALAAFERRMTAGRFVELIERPVAPSFDAAHLKEVHRRLYQDVYSFAGKMRTDPSAGMFGKTVEKQAQAIYQTYRDQNTFKTRSKEHFVAQFAQYMHAIRAVHPFPHGNAQTLAHFDQDLAQASGYLLTWKRIGKDAFHDAMVAERMGDFTPWRNTVRDLALPLRAVAFEAAYTMGQFKNAVARFPELAHSFKTVDLVRAELGAGADEKGSVAHKRLESVRKYVQRKLEDGAFPQPTNQAQAQKLLWSVKVHDR